MAAPQPQAAAAPVRRRQPPNARAWVFTIHDGHLLNNLTIQGWDDWARGVDTWEGVKYLVFQQERGGNTQRLHLQGYVHMTKQVRATQLSTLFNAKPEAFTIARGGPAASRAYCTKEDTREAGKTCYEYGECPGGQGKRMDLVAASIKEKGLKRTIDENMGTYITCHRGMHELDRYLKRQRVEGRTERPMETTVVWGDPGSGKSHWANTWDPGNTYVLPDLKRGERVNLDGYDGQRTLLIEDYDGQIEYRTLLRMLDVYNCDFNTKGSMVAADWKYVLITSNLHPNTWYGNDKDPWYYEPNKMGPLQRRLTRIIRAEGMHPNSHAVLEDGTRFPFSDLQSLAELRELQAQAEGRVPAAGTEVPAEVQPVPAVRSVPAAGTEEPRVPAEAELNDLMDYDQLDALLQDAGVPPMSLPSDDDLGLDETDAILLGLDGDDEDGIQGHWTHF